MRPDADLVLTTDPDGMPWGPRTPEGVAERALGCARAAEAYRLDVLIVACNTASVHALEQLRAELEPGVPVVGTVPAIKPAAACGGPVAIWATPATTASAYQRDLIARFADGVPVAEVACPGLADAVDTGDLAGIEAAVADAARRTPSDVRGLVLGCTHYELVADAIRAAVPVALFGSATAVAAQALRRIGAAPAPDAPATGTVTVLRTGRLEPLPETAKTYPQGRALAAAQPHPNPTNTPAGHP
jgi:glutamate racemase